MTVFLIAGGAGFIGSHISRKLIKNNHDVILFDISVNGRLIKDIKNKVKVVEEPKLKPWGKWDFRIEDPFGFYLRVGETDNIIDDKDNIEKSPEIAKKKGLHL